ncbi:hypothetical protein LZ31DRAFT_391604 [Colletotrichum somersetense]|nr:hypothetical protein LZ31DRAFT_391604 [Colletotrichum somersetense]
MPTKTQVCLIYRLHPYRACARSLFRGTSGDPNRCRVCSLRASLQPRGGIARLNNLVLHGPSLIATTVYISLLCYAYFLTHFTERQDMLPSPSRLVMFPQTSTLGRTLYSILRLIASIRRVHP